MPGKADRSIVGEDKASNKRITSNQVEQRILRAPTQGREFDWYIMYETSIRQFTAKKFGWYCPRVELEEVLARLYFFTSIQNTQLPSPDDIERLV
jgi:hypothetical protein